MLVFAYHFGHFGSLRICQKFVRIVGLSREAGMKKTKKSRDEHLPQMLGLGRRYIYIDIYRAEPFSVNCKSCTLTSTGKVRTPNSKNPGSNTLGYDSPESR